MIAIASSGWLATTSEIFLIDDPAGDHDWRIRAEVDLRASAEEGAAVVRVTEVVRL